MCSASFALGPVRIGAGTAVWRVFKPNGEPTGQTGEQPGVPPSWSKAAAVFHSQDGFLASY